MLRLYNSLLWALRPAVEAWGVWQRRDPARRREWAERLGRGVPPAPAGAVWIHGASVGEARIVGALAAALRRRRPELGLVVSALTPTGRTRLPAPPDVDAACFAPLDLPGLAGRVLDRLHPSVLVLVETELWPNLLAAARGRGVPVVVVNGRLSDRRIGRYRRLGRLYRPLVAGLTAVGAQSATDAERFRELGARPGAVHVTGNVKYDLLPPAADPQAMRERLGLDGRRAVFVAGSTGEGEEVVVVDGWERARRSVGELLLVLAPRHPERANDVARQLERRGHRVARLSAGRPAGDAEIVLVDSVGQLAALYPLALVAFVGGSLVPIGGHNVLEPAAAGVPVLFGPHTANVAGPAERLLAAGGAIRVASGEELGRALQRLAADPAARQAAGEHARAVVEANSGALARSVELVLAARRGPQAPTGAERAAGAAETR